MSPSPSTTFRHTAHASSLDSICTVPYFIIHQIIVEMSTSGKLEAELQPALAESTIRIKRKAA